jgi:hypothetical protein
MLIGTFISAFTIAFIKGWLMTLVACCSLPIMVIAGIVYLKVIQNKDKKIQKNYA